MRLPEFFQWTPEERRAVLAIVLFTGGGGLLLELGHRFPQWTPDLRTARALVAADSAGSAAADSASPGDGAESPSGGADSSRAPLRVAALSGGAGAGEPAGDAARRNRGRPRPAGPVDLNHADAHRLADLPGVGPALAARIVDYRRAHGPFRSPADLDKVKGVGPALLQKLSGLVVMGGAEDSASSPP